jgi:hypothetical protein
MPSPKYGQIDQDYGLRLATTPPEEDGPVWMVNLMKYHNVAQYEGKDTSQISGREADDRYLPLKPLAAVGAKIVFVGDVEMKLLGDDRSWDRVAVVKYPTRRSFIEMQGRQDFQEKHVHKEAGMQETIVMGCLPIPSPEVPEGETSADWAKVEHPPRNDDGPVVALHVIKFSSGAELGQTPEELGNYTSKATKVALRNGVQISGWFRVEGTIVGDGRQWDQVRFNTFPSKAAFMEVVHDQKRLEAQKTHREGVIADTYTLLVRPMIDQLTVETDR